MESNKVKEIKNGNKPQTMVDDEEEEQSSQKKSYNYSDSGDIFGDDEVETLPYNYTQSTSQ